MASTVLPNGIIIPEKYSRDWYADLYHNWQELDNLLGGGTPKDGTLTIQKNGDTVGTFSANQATDETINIEVPAVNDATLTIQKNSTTVGTFSANQATNETVNIEVPDVNDATLTIQQNGTTVDSFSANSSSDKTVNIECVDLTSNQTVAGDKEFTGTTTAHDLVPSATDTYNFGSPTAQWNNAYIKSLTINGVQWGLDKANVWTGTQSFTSAFTKQEGTSSTHGYVVKAGFARGSAPSATTNLTFRWLDSNDNILGFLDFVATSSMYATRLNLRTENNGTQVAETIQFETDLTGNYFSFKPLSNGNVNLGTSTNKWKSFNGINPGALSLPSSSSYIDVDTTDWVLDGSLNIFTPTSDGWLGIRGADTVYDQTHYIFIGRSTGGEAYYQQNLLSPVNALWDNRYYGCVLIPVIKNKNYNIRCICSSIIATFYPCQGNV